MLDITLTKERREKKLLQEENQKLKDQILELTKSNGPKIAHEVAASLDEISELSNKIQAEDKSVPSLPETGQFVKTFTKPLRIQIEQGGLVNDVDPSGDASKNGIRSGDTIVSIDGVPLRLLYTHTQIPIAEKSLRSLIRREKVKGRYEYASR